MVGKGRTPCCDKTQVKKGPWSPYEDLRLISFIQKYGHDNWRSLPRQAGLLRCGKSCRLRWINYLRPDLKRGNFTEEEETALINLHQVWGNRWSKIASHFPGRTDNEIKNVWNTHLRKRVAKSKKFFTDNHSKELSTITSCSPASSSSGASFQLSSGEPDVGGAVKFEHHSGHGSNVAENLNAHELPNSATLQERLDQNSPTQVTNETRVDDDAKGSKATLTISSSVSSRDSSISSSSNLQGGISKPNDLVFDFTEDYEPLIANKAELKIPLEPDYDFWSILDEVDYDPSARYQSNDEVTEPLLPQVDEVYRQSSNLGLVENGKWLSYLESELGLEETTKTTTEDVVMKDATDRTAIVPEKYYDNIKLSKPAEHDQLGVAN